jgi:hypothetical protein
MVQRHHYCLCAGHRLRDLRRTPSWLVSQDQGR